VSDQAHIAGVLARAEADARAAQRRWRLVVWSGRALLLIFILGGWELVSGRLVDGTFISRPSAIFAAWWQLSASHTLWTSARITLIEMLSGYAIGAVLGVVVACSLSASIFAYRLAEPVLLVLYGIPTVALGPLLISWFGLGLAPKIILAGKATFILVVLNTVAGALAADSRTLSVLRLLGAGRLQLMRVFVLPNALPYLMTALRIAIPIAMIGTILGELIGSNVGLGAMLVQQATFLAIPDMFATIVTTTLCVFALRLALVPFEKIAARFFPQS
jgi:NitT/TauT family transport system permease protein